MNVLLLSASSAEAGASGGGAPDRPLSAGKEKLSVAEGKQIVAEANRLAGVMEGADFEAARKAHRDLAAMVHRAGRYGAWNEQRAVSDALIGALSRTTAEQARRNLLWLISEISEEEAVAPVEAFLMHESLRDDARMVLERIPGKRSLKALDTAMGKVPTEFRRAIAVSLRARGVGLQGLPSQKRVPSRPTRVKAKPPA